ncbi:helix-turn-helix transcriptional regulator [Cohnella yongneupensis]|uniref:Helix-turn-helix transcriptional regulator n=1 Tax=Cohnella yongneupensis TaxID=425006 RepID=A0ABW0R0S6_9BACL
MSQSEHNLLTETPALFSARMIDVVDPAIAITKDRDDLTSLCYIKDGRGEGTIGNVRYSVRQGEMVICHPFMSFNLQSSADHPLKGIEFTFSCAVAGRKPGHLLDPDQSPVLPLGNHFPILGNYFEALLVEHHQPSPGSQEMINSLLNAAIILILRMLEAMKAPQSNSITENVKAFIESHFEMELSIKDLAELVFVSPYHLIHTFKNEAGISPIQYLIHCRMEEAKRLLLCTDIPISEISGRIGYPNPNYFNQVFKKIIGESPGKFRNIAKR